MPVTYHIAGRYPSGADYESYSDVQTVAILAYGAFVLNGKILDICYQSTGTITMAARTYDPAKPLTIRAKNASCGLNYVNYSGAVHNIEWVGMNFKVQDWPRVQVSAIRASSGDSTGQNFTSCFMFHGHGAGHVPINPLTSYPELIKGAAGGTATTTSSRITLNWQDANNLYIAATAKNDGAANIYVKFGDSTVVATASDTLVIPGATALVNSIDPRPTHVAVIAVSGSQAMATTAEIGMGTYLASTFSASGSGSISGNLRGCIFDSLMNADVGMTARVVMDCLAFGIYADIGGGRFYTDGIPMVYARNRFQRAFATSSHAGTPHCDGYQQAVGANVLDGLIWAANHYFGTHLSGFQTLFLSDETGAGGYRNIFAIANIVTGNNGNQMHFAEGPGSGNGFCAAFGNTVVNIWDNGLTSNNVKFSNPASRSSYMGYNLVTGLQAESEGLGVEFNSVVTTANLLTKIPLYNDMKLATSAELLRIAAATPDSAGAVWADQFIDNVTTDPMSVVRWSLLPAMVDYIPVTGVATSTVITTPLKKVLGFASTATDLPFVPNAGVEWGTFSDEAGTVAVRAFGTGTGVVRRGHTYQMRGTSPATAATAFTIGAMINGYAVTANYTTI